MEASTLTFFHHRLIAACFGPLGFILLTLFPISIVGQGLVQDPPLGRSDGVEVLAPDRVHFQLRAPSKDHVHLRGDFNDWLIGESSLMNRSLDGDTWWLEVEGILPGSWQRYHYLIDDTLEVADPFAPLILDPWNDGYLSASTFPSRPDFPNGFASWPVGAVRTEALEFEWGDSDFQRPDQDRLVIYELLIRDWDDAQTFDAVVQRMDHLAWLGITAIELMPVSEFDGNLSWGYNPGPRFAVHRSDYLFVSSAEDQFFRCFLELQNTRGFRDCSRSVILPSPRVVFVEINRSQQHHQYSIFLNGLSLGLGLMDCRRRK